MLQEWKTSKITLLTCTHNDKKLFSSSLLLWRCGPTRAMVSSYLRLLDHTRRRITVGRTPLDEWSARRRDLYLTTHNTHNRQTSMRPVGFEPTISAGKQPQNYAEHSMFWMLFFKACLVSFKDQLESKWMDFHEIWYLRIFQKPVEEIQVSLKSHKNNGHFTWSHMYIYGNILINSSLNEKCFRQKLYRKSKHTFYVP